MPKTATIVYWYGLDQIQRDGGGIRVLGWKHALEQLDHAVSVVGLNARSPQADSRNSLGRLKRLVLPMPFARTLPPLPKSDLYVITVPAVMASALRKIDNSQLVFDWPDLWSTNARTIGNASWHSALGGRMQSLVWKRRERRFMEAVSRNAFAGFSDCLGGASDPKRSSWLPSPVDIPEQLEARKARKVRTVGFLGNLAYPPNEISLRAFLVRWAEPLEREGIRVVVAGFGSEVVKEWGFNVEVMGEVESVRTFYERIDAAIVPIDHGGGIKVKAIEAMAYGVPVYGTEHVRLGFSPEIGKFIGSIEVLLEGDPMVSVNPPNPDLFRRVFSQLGFTRRVESLLAAGMIEAGNAHG